MKFPVLGCGVEERGEGKRERERGKRRSGRRKRITPSHTISESVYVLVYVLVIGSKYSPQAHAVVQIVFIVFIMTAERRRIMFLFVTEEVIPVVCEIVAIPGYSSYTSYPSYPSYPSSPSPLPHKPSRSSG